MICALSLAAGETVRNLAYDIRVTDSPDTLEEGGIKIFVIYSGCALFLGCGGVKRKVTELRKERAEKWSVASQQLTSWGHRLFHR